LAGLGNGEPEEVVPRKKYSGRMRGKERRGVNQIGAAVRDEQFLPVKRWQRLRQRCC